MRLQLALLALLTLGCANQITWAQDSTPRGPWRPAFPAPLVVDWIETRRAGFETNPDAESIAFCVARLREAGLFSEVYEPRRAWTAPAGNFRLALRIDESYDRHAGATGTKLVIAIVTGALPSLFVPFYADDRVVVDGELRTPAGARRSYRVQRAAGIRSFLLGGLTHAERQLRGELWSEALWALAAAISDDAAALASPPPTPEPKP